MVPCSFALTGVASRLLSEPQLDKVIGARRMSQPATRPAVGTPRGAKKGVEQIMGQPPKNTAPSSCTAQDRIALKWKSVPGPLTFL